ncbi:hypothetical protein CR62_24120 [Serratia grimesii]|uniref:Uncharacterized protein n=1 Tax=Serratia grimesii TaxID=82995 RepID=A0ABR4UAV1_9GAMM|nr:hypothetical protein CR62_24120 [Serratia grimesii]
MDKFSKPEQFDAAVEIHGGEPFAVWAPAVNGSHVKAELYFALQHESAVNWEAATSLVAENEELKRALEAKDKRIAELEQRLATPVRVPSPAMFDEDDSAETVISVTRARLRAQGFKVATDGATTVGDE